MRTKKSESKVASKASMMKLKNYLGLEYVTLHIRPDRVSAEYGPVVSAERFQSIDKKIVAILVASPRPIRGKELRVIRKVIGLGVREFALAIGVSHPTVMNWEKAEDSRLDRAEEAFVRVFFSQRLGVKLEAKIEVLAPEEPIESPLEYTAA
jgi:DNA-binding transcriptional regulator YiaG